MSGTSAAKPPCNFPKEEIMKEVKPVQPEGPIVPRCLATLPLDIEEILKNFEEQE